MEDFEDRLALRSQESRNSFNPYEDPEAINRRGRSRDRNRPSPRTGINLPPGIDTGIGIIRSTLEIGVEIGPPLEIDRNQDTEKKKDTGTRVKTED